MNDFAPNVPNTIDRDELVDRIASGDLTAATWARWSDDAADDVVAWRTMAETLRDQLALVDLAQSGLAAADLAALPALTAAEAADSFDAASLEALMVTEDDASPACDATTPAISPAMSPATSPAAAATSPTAPALRFHGQPADRTTPRLATPRATHVPASRARGAAGWLVAAMLLLTLIVSSPLRSSRAPSIGPVAAAPDAGSGPSAPSTNVVQTAGISADDALDLYLDRGRAEGRVVRESPTQVLISSRPAADGNGLEITYVRQILERTVVPEMFVGAGRDESGGIRLARIEPRRPKPPM